MSGLTPFLTLSWLTNSNIFCSDAMSTDSCFWVNSRGTEPVSLGLTVRNVKVCLAIGPKILLNGLSKNWALSTSCEPILESKTSFLMSGLIGKETTNKSANNRKRRALAHAGIKPKNLLTKILENLDKNLRIRFVESEKNNDSVITQTKRNPTGLAAILGKLKNRIKSCAACGYKVNETISDAKNPMMSKT